MPCQSPHLDEKTSASRGISPGLVGDEESLLREVLNPDHVVDGVVQRSAISVKDLKERGFSVHRLRYVTRKFVEGAINEKLARPFDGKVRVSEGVARFTVRAVRDIQENGKQAFVVVDSATRPNPVHASIFLSNVGMKDSFARSMRDELLPLLEKRMSVAEALAEE